MSNEIKSNMVIVGLLLLMLFGSIVLFSTVISSWKYEEISPLGYHNLHSASKRVKSDKYDEMLAEYLSDGKILRWEQQELERLESLISESHYKPDLIKSTFIRNE